MGTLSAVQIPSVESLLSLSIAGMTAIATELGYARMRQTLAQGTLGAVQVQNVGSVSLSIAVMTAIATVKKRALAIQTGVKVSLVATMTLMSHLARSMRV